jgi:WD40 repeat protein
MSHNGRFFITGAENGEIRMWEMRTRELVSTFKEHKQRVTSLALFNDDTIAVSSSKDRCILRWDLRQEVITLTFYFQVAKFNSSTYIAAANVLPYATNGRDQLGRIIA